MTDPQGPSEPNEYDGPEMVEPVEALGRQVVRRWQEMRTGLAFVGRTTVTLGRAFAHGRRLRLTSVVRHVYDTGITAMPIVALIAFLISVIIAYMSAQQLQQLRRGDLRRGPGHHRRAARAGVLLTAIIVAGRSGSAFAAEIGAMQLNEEVDALEATGVDPYEVLVVPRVLGLVIALPLLTVIADLVGLTGGALLCRLLLDMPITQYLGRVNDAIAPTTFWVGIIKAPVFALLIALAGTYRGMQVRGLLARARPAHHGGGRAVHLPRDSRGRVVRRDLHGARHLSDRKPILVEVRGIVNRFGAQVVHDGLDMEVLPDEVFGIVGGSGSGKSVLLRTILGLQPSAGRHRVPRRPRHHEADGGRAARRSSAITASPSSRARCSPRSPCCRTCSCR